MNPFFDNLQNLSGMLSDEQKDDLKQMGERFYGPIDMDKYRPVPKEEAKDDLFSVEYLERAKYVQLQKAIDSGLLEEDLTPDELEILKKYAPDA
jgi:hypothetical protein